MDKILKLFFEKERWSHAIEKGVGKDISKGYLYLLCKPETRVRMCEAMLAGKYEIAPPHIAKIPKDNPGEFRTVYINEPIDRVFLSIANDLLYELMPESIHPRCMSYRKGIGCGKIVKHISQKISDATGEIIGWKSDLSKYFDSVPVNYIDHAFDMVEERHGHSCVIDVLRKYYHCDLFFDEDGALHKTYQSLKQGCSVAAWLANVLLYHIDYKLSKMNGDYVRYSDDMLFVGKDYEKAMSTLQTELSAMNMKLNPQKVEYLSSSKWFKFLGYSIRGSAISLSKNKIKRFQKEIERITVKKRDTTLQKAINAVNRLLYKGNGEYSWATQVLPVCNVRKDIDTLNKYVLDALRAVQTGKRKIGGLGYVATQSDGCINRGTGKNVKANRNKTPSRIEGYYTIACMQNALLTNRAAYNTLISCF